MRKRGAELPSTRSSPLAPWVRGRGKGAGLEAQRLPRSKLLGRKAGGDAHKSRAPLQRAKERKMLLGKAGLQNWVLAEWRGESRASALGILILILIPFLLCHILTLPTDPPASVCTTSRADAAAAAFLHYLLLCSGRALCFPWGRILTGFDFKEQIPPVLRVRLLYSGQMISRLASSRKGWRPHGSCSDGGAGAASNSLPQPK